MAFINLPNRWRRQPPPGTYYNISPRWDSKLHFVAMPGMRTAVRPRTAYDVNTDPSLSVPGFHSGMLTKKRVTAGTSSQYSVENAPLDGSSAYTIICVAANVSEAVRTHAIMLDNEDGGDFTQIVLALNTRADSSVAAGRMSFFEYDNGFNVNAESGTGAVDGLMHVYAARRNGSTPTVWRDGFNITSASTPGATTVATWGDQISFGCGTQDRQPQHAALGIVFYRALSDTEMYELGQNPWQIFTPRQRRVYLATAAAGGTSGTVAVTEAADTSTASGTTEILGTQAVTEAADTSTASGTTTVTGSVAVTEAADTMSASGGSETSGTVAVTEAADAMSASGTTTVLGTSGGAEAADTMSASGSVGDAVAGSLAVTEAADTSTASGTTTVLGTVAVTEAADAITASGTTTVVGSVAVTEAADTATATGVTGSVTGTLAVTEQSDAISANGNVGTFVLPSGKVFRAGGRRHTFRASE